MNTPNVITLARIVLVPVFALLYLYPHPATYLASAVFFTLAAFTDWLDGYLARRFNQTTPFGAFLDPVADKLIVVTALVLLVAHHANVWLTVPALIIIGRELVISALREWMAEMHQGVRLAVSWLAKVKTVMQMTAIAVLLANPPALQNPWVYLGYGVLYIASVLTLWSMVQYLKVAWPSLKRGLADAKQVVLK